MPKLITEAAGAGALTGSRMEITLITPGWGSSGYYSTEMLAKAAEDKVFPTNTQMHIDHMTETARFESPAGSVATLAAVLNEDARWEPNWVDPKTGVKGRLTAESRVFSHWREPLADMADAIGVSIAAAAETSMGEAEGRKGRIIEALIPDVLNRVDFVTVAGRGGRITEVLESAKVQEARNVGMWLEARMHSMFTNISDEMYGDGRLTREERITLSSALGQALSAFTATVEDAAPQLFERDLWEDPTPTSAAENAVSKDSAPNPAAVTENQEDASMATIDEKELADLRESASRATVAEADVTKAQERVTAAEAVIKESNEETASTLVDAALESAGVTAPKLAARLKAGFPVKENGAIDLGAFREEVTESIAELQAAGGAGSVRGTGHTEPPAATPAVTLESARADILKLAGYTPKGA